MFLFPNRSLPLSLLLPPLPLFFILLLLLLAATPASAHGCMHTPNQRGTLAGRGRQGHGKCAKRTIDLDAPMDSRAHFPAGPRTGKLGEGVRYQRRQAGPYGWVPFQPLNPRFRWRAGVCGDKIGLREAHRKGGQYYYGGKVVATYRQGGVIKLGLRINAHHNGFVEVHICDASRCRGDISRACFRRGHCRQLKRAFHPACQSGYHRFCGPIDNNYPGRWYLPCSAYPPNDRRVDYYGEGGKGYIYYQLPKDFHSDHAVIQWFWTAANTCNPPGVVEYFQGRNRPRNWGRCKGQASAKGGYVHRARPCGGRHFPEEYLQCADIRVVRVPRWRRRRPPAWLYRSLSALRNTSVPSNGTGVTYHVDVDEMTR